MGIPLYTKGEKPSNSETSVPTASNKTQSLPSQTTGNDASAVSTTTSITGHPTAQPFTGTASGSGSSTETAGSRVEGRTTLRSEEAERLYEERMEEEYAKREGGA